jgi:hypothetical protein
MREIYKNPMFYYVLIPVLVGMWPLLVRARYLPRAEDNRRHDGDLCVDGQAKALDILFIDPERPTMTTKNVVPTEFSYGAAVDRVANLCKIPATNWDLAAGGFMSSSGKKRQDARVKLTNVSIVQDRKSVV